MNATPPISPLPPSPNPIQTSAAGAADQADRSGGQDFAGVMNAAGGKSVRKPAAKQHDSAQGGGALPVAGNQPPPSAAATAGAPPTGQAGTAVVSSNPANGAATAAPAAGAAAAPATPEQVAAPPIASAAAEELAAAAPPSPADFSGVPPTPGGAMASAGQATPHAPSIQAPPIVVPAQGAPPAAAPSVATTPSRAAVPASKAEIAAATSAPTSTNADATQNAQSQAAAASPADANAAAQAAMAAALAQGTNAPTPDSSVSSDDLATPDTGLTLQGSAAANDVAAPLPTGISVQPATSPTSASVIAASAAHIAQAVSASADSGPTDKHSRDNSPDGSLGAAQLLTSNGASDAAPSPTPTFRVSAGMDTAEFGQGVADRVSLMMDGNLTNAKLQVNPPALGPIEVRIALQGGHAQVWMSSHSAVTRDALESSAPKLREMLGSQGFAQVSVDISQRSFQDRTPQPKGYESVSALDSGSSAPAHAPAATARSASGLLDAYA